MVLLYSLVAIWRGERIPVSDGFGWDGVVYGEITKDFSGQIFGGKVNGYHLQRIFPCAVVHYGLRLMRLSTTDGLNVLRGFQVYNALLLVLGVYVWWGIAAKLRLSARATWLGFVALYVNFATLKMPFYYAVLSDTTAFVGGLILLYCFLAEKPFLLFLTGLLGAFSWPIFLQVTLLLMLFPCQAAMPSRPSLRLPAWLYAIPGAFVGLLTFHRYFIEGKPPPGYVDPIWRATAPLALALVVLYLVLSVRELANRGLLDRLIRPFREVTRRSVILTLALFLSFEIAFALPRSSGQAGWGTRAAIETTFLLSIAKPGIFLVAHAVYFGPIVFLTILAWPRVCSAIRGHGLGFTAVLFLGLVLSITSESRHLLCFFPLFVAVAMQAINTEPFSWRHDGAFIAASVLASKCWLPLNQEPFSGRYSDFPFQYYFMNQGPWMSAWCYAIQGTVAFALFFLFAMLAPKPDHPKLECSGRQGVEAGCRS
jgi:hypothetical protein